MFGDALELDGVAAEFEGGFDGLACEEAVVEADGEFDGGTVSDGFAHADDVGDVLDDGVGLGFGVAGVEDEAVNIVGEDFEEAGDRLTKYSQNENIG